MDTLEIHFKPTGAPKYRIQWRKRTDTAYPLANNYLFNKEPGEWNIILIDIDDITTDWVYRITAVCGPQAIAIGKDTIINAFCVPVTMTSEFVDKAICADINNIIMTTSN